MKRDIFKDLMEWKKSSRRKPLILDGARQVGKTYALQYFGQHSYEKMAYFNFEKDEKLRHYFEGSLDPKKLIQVLSIHGSIEIEPENTLLIFDEVQECPRALNSLKYFCEEAGQYHIAAAGSLLGVKTASQHGFPVGKVNFLHLYPLNFFEFLSAVGETKLREFLESIEKIEPIPEPLHEKLINYLKHYFFIGGMPEVVAEYIRSGKLEVVREVQREILDAYEKDFGKHAPSSQIMKLTTVWKGIHQQLAKENKKFIFSAIRKSARGRDYEEAIQWLVDAGLIHKSFHVNTPKLPISAYTDRHIFKIFLLDVGLLGAQSNLSIQAVINGNRLFTEFKGSLTENFVAQELIASGHQGVYYWTSPGTAEVDFVVQGEESLYPLEVKAGTGRRKKSLLVYGEKYKSDVLSRVTLRNLKKDGKVLNVPLYLISLFPNLPTF